MPRHSETGQTGVAELVGDVNRPERPAGPSSHPGRSSGSVYRRVARFIWLVLFDSCAVRGSWPVQRLARDADVEAHEPVVERADGLLASRGSARRRTCAVRSASSRSSSACRSSAARAARSGRAACPPASRAQHLGKRLADAGALPGLSSMKTTDCRPRFSSVGHGPRCSAPCRPS